MWFWKRKKRADRDLRSSIYEPRLGKHRKAENAQWGADFQGDVETVFQKFQDIQQTIELEDGSKLLLLDRLAKEDEYGEEECARNIYRVRADGSIMWQVKSKFDNATSGPFTSMKYKDGKLTAYRWEGIVYDIDIATGEATAEPGQRPW